MTEYYQIVGGEEYAHWCTNCPDFPGKQEPTFYTESLLIIDEENIKHHKKCPKCSKLEKDGKCEQDPKLIPP